MSVDLVSRCLELDIVTTCPVKLLISSIFYSCEYLSIINSNVWIYQNVFSDIMPDSPLEPSLTTRRKKKTANIGSKNAMGMIETDRQGVWKNLHKLQKKQRKEVTDKQNKQRKKSAIEKYQENSHDYTEASIKALLRITEMGKVDDDAAEKILYKQPCRLARDIKEQPSETIKSVFTEEDFQKFEQQYHPK